VENVLQLQRRSILQKQFPITAAQNENVEPKSTLSATLPNLKMNAKQEEKRNPS